jgi:NAD(P)-dependent dehydrogenase (short-subunit alcohol dehydrogenase family)
MGEATVKALAGRGARVVSLDIAQDRGTRIANAVGAHFISCDVTDEESVRSAFGSAVTHLGGLDALVHAAGIAPGAPAEETSADTWDLVMDVNAKGTFLTNVAAFEALKDRGGRIVNFASAAGAKGYPRKAAYAASKGAVLAWVRSVAVEWAPYNITVNSVAPAIWTPMYETTRASMTPEQLAEHDRTLLKTIPLGGRLGDVDTDLVPAIEFLIGEGSKFITGQILAVDGGGLMVR